jgi:hypothetical protein
MTAGLISLNELLPIIIFSSQSQYIAAAIETESSNTRNLRFSLMLEDKEFIVGLNLAVFMAFVYLDRQQ